MCKKQQSLPKKQSSSFKNNNFYVLIIDLIGMIPNKNGQPDISEVKKHIEAKGHQFHHGSIDHNHLKDTSQTTTIIHFVYQPNLSKAEDIVAQTALNDYDGVIAAATIIPDTAFFRFGGVRIGAGTGNMKSNSWGGVNGLGGKSVLMNTPSYNTRATAQSAFKALLKVTPDLAVEKMHNLVVKGDFDTGMDLPDYPTTKLESKRLAIIGFGNIGREMAKIGSAFGMKVIIHARRKHKKWIESEGFEFADTLISAVTKSDIISPHIGLGAFNEKTKSFTNAGIIDSCVFSVMNKGAILINYDRGEIVNIKALDDALSSGQISYAAIDADIFKDPATNKLSGPMVPYRDIYHKHPEKMQLLPHAAADTEHVSRVEGAKQAVNQIIDLLINKTATNLIGDLPNGFKNAGSKTVKGIGKITSSDLNSINESDLTKLAKLANDQAAFWQHLASGDDILNNEFAEHSEESILKVNQYISLLKNLGIHGPYQL